MIVLEFFGRETAGGKGTEMRNQGDILVRLVMDTRDDRKPSSDGRRLSERRDSGSTVLCIRTGAQKTAHRLESRTAGPGSLSGKRQRHVSDKRCPYGGQYLPITSSQPGSGDKMGEREGDRPAGRQALVWPLVKSQLDVDAGLPLVNRIVRGLHIAYVCLVPSFKHSRQT